jgi:hypothetical protein
MPLHHFYSDMGFADKGPSPDSCRVQAEQPAQE